MSRFRSPSRLRLGLAGLLLPMALAHAAVAVGGDDASPSNQINAATQKCQYVIAKGGATYANKAAAAMNSCLDAIVKCDEQATPEKALDCRRKLVVRDKGKCAVGKVDEGASLIGNGAAAHASSLPLSKAVLIREMRKYTTAVQKKCFGVGGVDLGSVSMGLGFSPAPGTDLALADATNQDPGGMQCLANGLVLKTHPLANGITQLVDALHGKCAAADLDTDLGIACTVDLDCGPAEGRCGALARVFRGGSITPCDTPASVVAVCGNGTAESPEKCDDGNLLNGDGCSSGCTVEVPLPAVCGNGLAQGPLEKCDDGNLLSGDGCSSTCQLEVPVAAVCGNGLAQGPIEKCDDGNLLNGDGCSSTCQIEAPVAGGSFPATGQTTCWNTAGSVIACAGTGHDGEIQAGAALAYVDNGDGTITDSNTGLMWEKLSDDGTIHDKDGTQLPGASGSSAMPASSGAGITRPVSPRSS